MAILTKAFTPAINSKAYTPSGDAVDVVDFRGCTKFGLLVDAYFGQIFIKISNDGVTGQYVTLANDNDNNGIIDYDDRIQTIGYFFNAIPLLGNYLIIENPEPENVFTLIVIE